MISIPNLSPLQQAIADMLWSLDSEQEIVDWINSLPVDIVPVAHTVLAMMVYAQIDQIPLTDFPDALQVINHIKEL
jgi:hypothetical protein